MKEFVFLEHYAGHGAMSREISKMYEKSTAKLDIEYHRGMDILSPAGFAFETYIEQCMQLQSHPILSMILLHLYKPYIAYSV